MYLNPHSTGVPFAEGKLVCAKPATPTPAPTEGGSYVHGEVDSNNCPEGSSRIDKEAACQAAAKAQNLAYGGSVEEATSPKGCWIWTGDNNMYLNTHSTGVPFAEGKLVCAKDTTTTTATTAGTTGGTTANATTTEAATTLAATTAAGATGLSHKNEDIVEKEQ